MTEFNTIQPPKVAGVVDPHYNNANANRRRIEQEEAELEAMINGAKAPEPEQEEEQEEVQEEPQVEEKVVEVEEKEEAPLSAEDANYKKRYGDLRRHANELTDRIKALEAKLESGDTKAVRPPKSDEDIAAWAKKYPDIAAIVETIAEKKAAEKFSIAEDRLKRIDEEEARAKRINAVSTIKKSHPDFEELKNSDEFHEWAGKQTKFIQDALYENQDDPNGVIRAIDLYKLDKGMDNKSVSKANKEAASAIVTKRTTKPDATETGKVFTESQVQKMTAEQYEKQADAIMTAIQSGNFVYDISGAAR